jgi:hypothetical protein
MQRGAPTATQRAGKPDDDEKDPKKEPLLSRDDDPTDDGLDNPDANEADDEDKDIQIVVVS